MRDGIHRILFVTLLACQPPFAAQAQTDAGDANATLRTPIPSTGLGLRGFGFSGRTSLGGSTANLPESPTRYLQWLQLEAGIRHKESGLGLGATGCWGRQSAEENVVTNTGNPVVTATELLESDDGWYSTLTFGLSAVLPGSEDVRTGMGFRYAAGPYVEWMKEFGRLTVIEMISYSHGVYQRDFSELESPAIMPEVVKSATTVDFRLTEKLYLEAVVQLIGVESYAGSRDARYHWSAGLGYEFNETISADAGFGTCYGAGQPNGHFDQLDVEGTVPPNVGFADLVISL